MLKCFLFDQIFKIKTKNLKPLFAFSIFFILLSCDNARDIPYNSKLSIQYDIEKLTDIRLDTTQFEVLLDSIHHTEGAFDLDYTLYVKIKLSDECFATLKDSITSSSNFNKIQYEWDKNWIKIDTANIKGVWNFNNNNYQFIQKPLDFNPEPYTLSIESNTKIMSIELIHL